MPTFSRAAANVSSICRPIVVPDETSSSKLNSRPSRSRIPSRFVSFQPAASRRAAAAAGSYGSGATEPSYAGESGAQGPEMILADPLKSSRTRYRRFWAA